MFKNAMNYLSAGAQEYLGGHGGNASDGVDCDDGGAASSAGTDHIVGSVVDVGGIQVSMSIT